MLDCWQRIEQIIKWAGAASVSAFAREIGLNRSENLYQIRRGNNGISRELAESIVAKYPEISKAWLLTGEGDMLPIKGAQKRFDIPFYKSDAQELIATVMETTARSEKSIEELKRERGRDTKATRDSRTSILHIVPNAPRVYVCIVYLLRCYVA